MKSLLVCAVLIGTAVLFITMSRVPLQEKTPALEKSTPFAPQQMRSQTHSAPSVTASLGAPYETKTAKQSEPSLATSANDALPGRDQFELESQMALSDLPPWLPLPPEKTDRLVQIMADLNRTLDELSPIRDSPHGLSSEWRRQMGQANARRQEALDALFTPDEKAMWEAYTQVTVGRANLRELNARLPASDRIAGEALKSAAVTITDAYRASTYSAQMHPGATGLIEALYTAASAHLSQTQLDVFRGVLIEKYTPSP